MRFAVASVRYRPWGTVALFLLATLAAAAAAFAPLYERAVGEAGLHAVLSGAEDAASGLALSATTDPDSPPVDPAAALRQVDRRLYGTPLAARQLAVTYRVAGLTVQGPVVARDAQCAHLRMVAGRCPATATGGVAVSTSAARVLRVRIGTSLTLTGDYPGAGSHTLAVPVVGLYAPFAASDGYWFDHTYSSAAGAQQLHNANGPEVLQADALFADASFFDAFAAAADEPTGQGVPLPVTVSLELPLRADRVGLNDTERLRRGITATVSAATAAGLVTQTALPDLLDTAATGRDEANRIIPAFAVELALLVVVALAIVVQSAVEDRRAETGLARLRGMSGPAVTRAVLGELLPIAVAGLVAGYGVAVAMTAAAGRWWLDGRAHPETRWAPVLAALAVLLAQAAFVATVAWRAARRPVHELLQGVHRAPSRRGATALELVVVAAAAAGVVVTVSGDRSTLLALVTPGLLALVAGLLLSRLAAALAGRVGRALFWRGRRAGAYAALQFARRPGSRRLLAVVCVATAVAVAACAESVVAADNRTARAAVTAGASTVLTTDATDADRLRQAVRRADPHGTDAAAVITQAPPNGPAVLAADAGLRTVADWGWPGEAPPAATTARLTPPLPPPVTVTGSAVELRLTQATVTRTPYPQDGSRPASAYLLLELAPAGGPPYDARLGPLPGPGAAAATLRAGVPCLRGCRVTGLSVLRAATDFDQLTVSALVALAAGPGPAVTPVPLGPAGSWAPASGPASTSYAQPDTIALTAAGTALRLALTNAGTPTELRQLSTPDTAPALAATGLSPPPDASGHVSGTGVDGLALPLTVVGRVPFLPGPARPQLLVDLDYAIRVAGTSSVAGGTAAVWLRRSDRGLVRRVEDALGAAGIRVVGVDSAAARRSELDATSPAAAMRLALLTAALAVLLAALVQVLTSAAGARGRRADRAALVAIGADARALARGSLLEHLGAVVVGAVAGACAGALASVITLPGVPIFVQAAGVPATHRATPVSVVLVAGAAVLLVLALVALAGTLRPGGASRVGRGGRRGNRADGRRHAA